MLAGDATVVKELVLDHIRSTWRVPVRRASGSLRARTGFGVRSLALSPDASQAWVLTDHGLQRWTTERLVCAEIGTEAWLTGALVIGCDLQGDAVVLTATEGRLEVHRRDAREPVRLDIATAEIDLAAERLDNERCAFSWDARRLLVGARGALVVFDAHGGDVVARFSFDQAPAHAALDHAGQRLVWGDWYWGHPWWAPCDGSEPARIEPGMSGVDRASFWGSDAVALAGCVDDHGGDALVARAMLRGEQDGCQRVAAPAGTPSKRGWSAALGVDGDCLVVVTRRGAVHWIDPRAAPETWPSAQIAVRGPSFWELLVCSAVTMGDAALISSAAGLAFVRRRGAVVLDLAEGHRAPARDVAWTADGATVLTRDEAGEIFAWDGSPRAWVGAFPEHLEGAMETPWEEVDGDWMTRRNRSGRVVKLPFEPARMEHVAGRTLFQDNMGHVALLEDDGRVTALAQGTRLCGFMALSPDASRLALLVDGGLVVELDLPPRSP